MKSRERSKVFDRIRIGPARIAVALIVVGMFSAVALRSQTLPTVKLIAHRGNSSEYAENSMGAFLSAYLAGANFIEFDVWLTRDGKSVIMHDQHLGRTTDVEEVFGGDVKVTDLDLGDIKRLWIDGGSGFSPDMRHKERVPELNEVVGTFANRIGLCFNIKDWRRQNIDNILAALSRYSVDPSMVLLETRTTWNETPYPRWGLVFTNDVARVSPVEPSFSESGTVFNGNYFLNLNQLGVDPEQLTLELDVSVSHPSASGYLFEFSNSGDDIMPMGAMRKSSYGNIEFSFRTIDGYVAGELPSPNTNPFHVTYKVTVDSFIVQIGETEPWGVQRRSQMVYGPKVRLNVGSDAYGRNRLTSVIERIRYSSGEMVELGMDSITVGQTLPTQRFRLINFPIWAETFGIQAGGLTRKQMDGILRTGSDVLLWTVNDPGVMDTWLTEPKLKGILSDQVLILKDRLAFFRRLDSSTAVFDASSNTGATKVQVYPNPSSGTFTIYVYGDQLEYADFAIYDLLGRKISERSSLLLPGPNRVLWETRFWNRSTLARGTYFLRMQVGQKLETHRLVIAR